MKEIAYTGYVYIMTNKEKDRFAIKSTDDLVGAMLKFRRSSFRKRALPQGKRQCLYLVCWNSYDHRFKVIRQEAILKDMDDEALKAVISEFNPEWTFLNKEVLGWRRR